MTFLIIHFNTPELTTFLCGTIRKYHENDKIVIFDNSDKRRFVNSDLFDAEYIDNTSGKIIDFKKELLKYNIDEEVYKLNRCGSAKHSMTIDWCIRNIDSNFCLLDSDVLLRKAIDFCDDGYLTIGELNNKEVEYSKSKCIRAFRILPYAQFFNTKLIREKGIRYFDPNRILGTSLKHRNYDTGASFFEDIANNRIKTDINLDEYIVHYKGGSWAKSDYSKFLLIHKKLWI